MAPASSNNPEGCQRRENAVKQILKIYNLEYTTITPVEYFENSPFEFNNFIYRVDLSKPANPSTFIKKAQRPGTLLHPVKDVSTVIVRLSNPRAEGLNNAGRVENEVAAQHLFRQHLQASRPELARIVPEVYAWEPCKYPEVSDEAGFGWTLCEFMPGANLDRQFAKMTLPEKLEVIRQVADIFTVFQKTPLPATLKTHLGGLTFGNDGTVVGGQMPLLPVGPWDNYEDVWRSRFQQQLLDADKSSLLTGWKDGGIRDKIDIFLSGGSIAKLLEDVDITARSLTHGDLTTNNMLFDSKTKQVTALLDFDWSSVSHPAHEFFSGLADIGGNTSSLDKDLQAAVLSGHFGERSGGPSGEDQESWTVAKIWDTALADRGAVRPSSIRGIETLEKLRKLEELLCPFELSSDVMIERLTQHHPGKLEEKMQKAAANLLAHLESLSQHGN